MVRRYQNQRLAASLGGMIGAVACGGRFPARPPNPHLFGEPPISLPVVPDLSWLWAMGAGVVLGLGLGWLWRRRALARALRARRVRVGDDHLGHLEAVLVILESLLLNCRRSSKVVDLLDRLKRKGDK